MINTQQLTDLLTQLSQQANTPEIQAKIVPLPAHFSMEHPSETNLSIEMYFAELEKRIAELSDIDFSAQSSDALWYLLEAFKTLQAALQDCPIPSKSFAENLSLNMHYDNLNQHREWERRLALILRGKQEELNHLTCPEKALASAFIQQEIMALEYRVRRCQSEINDMLTAIQQQELIAN